MKNQPFTITLFYCSNALSPEEINSISSRLNNITIKSISLPCSGKVSLLYLIKSIETDSDGVILATCKLGECRYVQGNYRARKRIEYVNELIYEAGLGNGYVKFVSLEKGDKLPALHSTINNLLKAVRFEYSEPQDQS